MKPLPSKNKSENVTIRALDVYQDLLNLHYFLPHRYPFLLESVAHGTPNARYDILFGFPGDSLELSYDGHLSGFITPGGDPDFLGQLDAWWQSTTCSAGTSTLPFLGGWFVYLGYELAGQIEPSLQLPEDPWQRPIAVATRIPAAIIRDHQLHHTFLIAESGQEALVEQMEDDLKRLPEGEFASTVLKLEELNEEDPQLYLAALGRIKQYIIDGDVFQVNLSRLWQGRCADNTDASELYYALRRHNPAPFAGLADFSDWAIISSSPERLVKVKNSLVETRPIAGTRPRSDVPTTDNKNSRELRAHPKERAEHIMLIDLERNDLGRVCLPGSVQVNELMTLESYAHVHHIVSNVRGRLHPDITPGQVIRAVFPGGTITGCPKVRCMEIIAELEKSARGPYTGAMGYLNRDGSLDLNILIRTIVKKQNAIELRAGAGIVVDSIPIQELEETRAKARGLLLALGSDL